MERLRIIKLGGAAITEKAQHEVLNESVLESLTNKLHDVYVSAPLILIHGAGSFGHFEAKKYKVSQGFPEGRNGNSEILKGISLTRQSVTKLNAIVVSYLIKVGIPAVGVSPFGTWRTKTGQVVSNNVTEIQKMVEHGLVPVLHGDVVLDDAQGCSILSGDLIAEILSEVLSPQFVVFITDVPGVYDLPPSNQNAKLQSNIIVNEEEKGLHGQHFAETGVVHEHDVTGGMVSKLNSALSIARKNIKVFIVNAYVSNLKEIIVLGETPFIGTTVCSANK